MIKPGQSKKSSFSGNGGCVQVSRLKNGEVVLSDSKDPDKPPTGTFGPESWMTFMRECRNGDFDIEGA